MTQSRLGLCFYEFSFDFAFVKHFQPILGLLWGFPLLWDFP